MMRECPFKAYLYLSKIKGADTDDSYAKCGSAIHDYAEDSAKGRAKEPEYYLGKYNVPQINPNYGTDLHKRFYDCIGNLDKFLKEKGIPELTEFTEFTTPKGRKVRLQTRIDLQIENSNLPEAKGKVVVDYKSGKDVDKDEYKLQARCYMFAKNFEYKALFYSLLNDKYFVIDKLPKDYIPKVCDEYIDHIENRDLERTQNNNCQKFCPYFKTHCEANVYFQQIVPPAQAKTTEVGNDADE